MPRWLWFAPLAGLLIATALLAYRQGRIVAQITETDLIETYAVYYTKTYGPPALATDCVARPGAESAVWIVVSCMSPRGDRIDYPIDRLGRLLKLEITEEALDAPQT